MQGSPQYADITNRFLQYNLFGKTVAVVAVTTKCTSCERVQLLPPARRVFDTAGP